MPAGWTRQRRRLQSATTRWMAVPSPLPVSSQVLLSQNHWRVSGPVLRLQYTSGVPDWNAGGRKNMIHTKYARLAAPAALFILATSMFAGNRANVARDRAARSEERRVGK